jgi:hypothetical protein
MTVKLVVRYAQAEDAEADYQMIAPAGSRMFSTVAGV